MADSNVTVAQRSQQLAQQLARPELLDLVPYQSARRIGGNGDIWINANESPFNNHDIEGVNRYPECQPPAVIEAYASYAGVQPEQVICSRGADEAIELLIRTFCVAGQDQITIFGPTYGMYAISAKTCNVGVQELALTTQYQLPQDYAEQLDDSKLVFICNPNNPTGTVIAKETLEQVIAKLQDKIVVIDEAYIEFSPELSVADLICRYPNLVVLRTLSKAFALAGARCGFMLANVGIQELVMRVIAPYPVPTPVAQLAANTLNSNGLVRMRQQVADLKQQGDILVQTLKQIGAQPLPAHGNYVLASFANIDQVKQQLVEAGVVARCYSDPRLADYIRFSFSNAQETQVIATALTQQEQ